MREVTIALATDVRSVGPGGGSPLTGPRHKAVPVEIDWMRIVFRDHRERGNANPLGHWVMQLPGRDRARARAERDRPTDAQQPQRQRPACGVRDLRKKSHHRPQNGDHIDDAPGAPNPRVKVGRHRATDEELRREGTYHYPFDDGQGSLDGRTDVKDHGAQCGRQGDEREKAHDALVKDAGKAC